MLQIKEALPTKQAGLRRAQEGSWVLKAERSRKELNCLGSWVKCFPQVTTRPVSLEPPPPPGHTA